MQRPKADEKRPPFHSGILPIAQFTSPFAVVGGRWQVHQAHSELAEDGWMLRFRQDAQETSVHVGRCHRRAGRHELFHAIADPTLGLSLLDELRCGSQPNSIGSVSTEIGEDSMGEDDGEHRPARWRG